MHGRDLQTQLHPTLTESDCPLSLPRQFCAQILLEPRILSDLFAGLPGGIFLRREKFTRTLRSISCRRDCVPPGGLRCQPVKWSRNCSQKLCLVAASLRTHTTQKLLGPDLRDPSSTNWTKMARSSFKTSTFWLGRDQATILGNLRTVLCLRRGCVFVLCVRSGFSPRTLAGQVTIA